MSSTCHLLLKEYKAFCSLNSNWFHNCLLYIDLQNQICQAKHAVSARKARLEETVFVRTQVM